VILQDHVAIVTNEFTHGGDAFLGHLHDVAREAHGGVAAAGPGAVPPLKQEVQLDAVVPLGQRRFAAFDKAWVLQAVGVLTPAELHLAGIGPQFVTLLPPSSS
jgi:hypothetical protein